MPSVLQISLEFGLPLAKVKAMTKAYDLPFTDTATEVDAAFTRAAYEIRYKRIAPYALAYVARLQRNPVAGDDRYRALTEYASPDYGHELETRIEALGDVWSDLLPDGKAVIDGAGLSKPKSMSALAACCKAVLARSSGQLSYDYLAARLLLSVPAGDMLDYPGPVRTAISRLNNRGYLDGFWHKEVDSNGKTKILYHAANSTLDL